MTAKASALKSLADAAYVAHQAYMTALAANPAADLSKLYLAQMAASNAWAIAEDKALSGAVPNLAAFQQTLDAETKAIKDGLQRFKNVASMLNGLDNLVQAAKSLVALFV